MRRIAALPTGHVHPDLGPGRAEAEKSVERAVARVQRRLDRLVSGAQSKRPSAFDRWLDTFMSEKEIDLEATFQLEGPKTGWNLIPYGSVVELMKKAPASEQAQLKTMLVKIDFVNGDVRDFMRHIMKAVVK